MISAGGSPESLHSEVSKPLHRCWAAVLVAFSIFNRLFFLCDSIWNHWGGGFLFFVILHPLSCSIAILTCSLLTALIQETEIINEFRRVWKRLEILKNDLLCKVCMASLCPHSALQTGWGWNPLTSIIISSPRRVYVHFWGRRSDRCAKHRYLAIGAIAHTNSLRTQKAYS